MIRLIVLLHSILLVVSCTSNESLDSIQIAIPGEPLSLDPYDHLDGYSLQVRAQIFNTLIKKNTNGQFEGVLARSWEYLSPTQLRFELRDDVYFHNGEKLTPKDVKYSIERQKTSIPNKDLFASIKQIETGSNTVDFHLHKPFIPILTHLSLPNAYIVNQKAVINGEIDSQEHIIGTGAYMFSEWIRGYSVTLKANTNFFLSPPSVSQLIFKVIPEESSRAIALENGEVDIARELSFHESDTLKTNTKIYISQFIPPTVSYLSVNTKNGIMTNQQIRKAISLSIDREGMIKSILFNKAKIADSLVPFNTFGYTNIGIKQDIQRAKKIIQQQNAQGETLIMYTLGDIHLRFAEVIQHNLKEIGLNIIIQPLELGTFLQYIAKGEQHLYLLNWTTLTADADFSLTQLLSKDSPWNNTFYSNSILDKKLELARYETNSQKRLRLYEEIQVILNNDLPYIPLFSISTITGMKTRLTGINNISGVSALDLQQVSLKKKKDS